ncbi:VOC family protein [Emcibacter sp. SYSU 3D8]|uniref:VOC family protein n=1 Tax=Emcibacter sp. SYSU 3D8 TaxID=3133969 RepID=UPI0031FE51AA
MKQHQNLVITQNAWVVRDLDQAIARFTRTMKVGPWFMIPKIALNTVMYRGKPAELDISVAVAFAGHVQLELIEQHNDSPSAYRDTVPKGQDGYHHICFYPDDYDAELARYMSMGYEVATSGQVTSANDRRFCYIDTRKDLNCMVELVDAPEGGSVVWAALREATDNWDGRTDPIRTMGL